MRQGQQGVREQRPLLRVHRGREVGADPRPRGGLGVPRVTDVDPVQGPAVRIRRGAAPGPVVGVDEAQGEGVGLGDGAPQGGLEEAGVEGAVDLDRLCGVVRGAVRREPLGVPEPLLGPGQRSTFVVLEWHSTTLTWQPWCPGR
ncbi:hypothetical protein GCM10019016_085310 [Streptomyces prasinosporus]|uniref:Uncharacterized protein n=1 Tax=Streptomyces prasinosporus TaxID=68256 RepID=A0ABP6U449_9ACTN